jgi:hypothetical protein
MIRGVFVSFVRLVTFVGLAAVAERRRPQISPAVHPFVATYRICLTSRIKAPTQR